MKKYLIIDETDFRSAKDKYHLFSDRDKAIDCLLKLGWKTGGLCGSMEITDKIGTLSMQQDGKDKKLTFVPIEEDDIPYIDHTIQPLKMLETAPMNGNPPVYVTIFEGIGGWNSGIFKWDCDGDFGFYEPQATGFNNTSFGTGLQKDAIREAIDWARDEELPCWIPK